MAATEPMTVAPPAVIDYEPDETNRGSLAWVYQAISGGLVLILVTVHMVAQHFVVSTGLRTFTDVIAFLSNPVMLVLEVLFLVVVSWHAVLGLRAVIFDFGLSDRAERAVTRTLYVLWAVTVLYGIWLLYTVINLRTT